MNKNLFIFFFLIVFSSSVFAIEQCQRVTSVDNIPCILFIEKYDSISDCNNITLDISNETQSLYSLTMSNYSNSYCNATFTETNAGVYDINYSTGDTYSITVERGKNMIYLFWFILTIICLLIISGINTEDVVLSSIGAIGLSIMGVYTFINGYNSINNLMTNFLSITFIMMGLYFLIPLFQWAVDELNIAG